MSCNGSFAVLIRPRDGFLHSVEERSLFPNEPLGCGRRVQVVTIRKTEDSSRFAAGFVNLEVPPAAQ